MPSPQYSVGDQVLIERETALRVDEKTDKDRGNNKLAPQIEGPFPAVALDEHTVTILRTTGLKDRVSTDRIVKAPSLRTELTISIPPEMPIPPNADAEPASPTTTDGNASTGPTDTKDRDTTRPGIETENATHRAEATRTTRSKSIARPAGGPPATGLMDAL